MLSIPSNPASAAAAISASANTTNPSSIASVRQDAAKSVANAGAMFGNKVSSNTSIFHGMSKSFHKHSSGALPTFVLSMCPQDMIFLDYH